MAILVLVRHGQSQWNLENRFTGCHIDNSQITPKQSETYVSLVRFEQMSKRLVKPQLPRSLSICHI